jgi:quercetin 2,3-dioxygenase
MIRVRRDSEIRREESPGVSARYHFSVDIREHHTERLASLLAFKDCRLAPGVACPLHPHRNVEAITYVVDGAFRHVDSLGDEGHLLPAGSVQRMTMGRGALHSEQNGSELEPVRFIQLGIAPREARLEPSVERTTVTEEDRVDRWVPVASPFGDRAVLVHQDATVYVSGLSKGTSLEHRLPHDHGAYLYVIAGEVACNDKERLRANDGVVLVAEETLTVSATDRSHLLMVEFCLDE